MKAFLITMVLIIAIIGYDFSMEASVCVDHESVGRSKISKYDFSNEAEETDCEFINEILKLKGEE